MIDKSVREERPVMSEPQKIQPSSLADVAASKFEKQGNVSAAAVGSGLDARNIYAWFGKYLAVSDMSIYFAAGTVTALIGPSGCGKSTFMRTLNRMHEFIPGAAMSGEVFLHGKDIYAAGTDVTKIRLKIGMVFQKPNPFPSMSIGENVLAGIKLAQLKVPNKNELMQECLERAGLWSEVKDRLNQPGGSLSGGQQQRLCIARSLAVNPDVLLMDEPCSALDPGSTLKIEETIGELAKTMAVIIVTHNMQQAARVSDYTAFLLSDGGPGQLIEFAPTREIFGRPKDIRTENYVTGRFG
jgi:phosphate transport system ATP-binding protein